LLGAQRVKPVPKPQPTIEELTRRRDIAQRRLQRANDRVRHAEAAVRDVQIRLRAAQVTEQRRP
jgi:hypothetical protein